MEGKKKRVSSERSSSAMRSKSLLCRRSPLLISVRRRLTCAMSAVAQSLATGCGPCSGRSRSEFPVGARRTTALGLWRVESLQPDQLVSTSVHGIHQQRTDRRRAASVKGTLRTIGRPLAILPQGGSPEGSWGAQRLDSADKTCQNRKKERPSLSRPGACSYYDVSFSPEKDSVRARV